MIYNDTICLYILYTFFYVDISIWFSYLGVRSTHPQFLVPFGARFFPSAGHDLLRVASPMIPALRSFGSSRLGPSLENPPAVWFKHIKPFPLKPPVSHGFPMVFLWFSYVYSQCLDVFDSSTVQQSQIVADFFALGGREFALFTNQFGSVHKGHTDSQQLGYEAHFCSIRGKQCGSPSTQLRQKWMNIPKMPTKALDTLH